MLDLGSCTLVLAAKRLSRQTTHPMAADAMEASNHFRPCVMCYLFLNDKNPQKSELGLASYPSLFV